MKLQQFLGIREALLHGHELLIRKHHEFLLAILQENFGMQF